MLNGLPVVLSETFVETVLHARSPSRARRRMKRGFPQHYALRPKMDAYLLPNGTLVMHPAAYAALKRPC